MPIEHTTDENGITHVSCEGTVTLDEMRMSYARFIALRTGPPQYKLITDLTAVTDIDLSFRDVLQLLVFVQTALRAPDVSMKIAIHAPRPRDRAIAKTFASLARVDQRFSITVHQDLRDAQAAIGL
ncbi:MAG: hypothetical protein ACRBCL_11750 [Maritimibacter sp.]